jgi:PTH1 family peptidyl-tRNA hydrolase
LLSLFYSVKSASIRLIVGLGNPGPDYEQTPHNAGFWLVDEIAQHMGARFRTESKFHGDACKIQVSGKDCWLLRPTTFMNHSGMAVSAMAAYYRIEPENILVAHDELDFPPGKIRLKFGGGHGGHNGLRDIIPQLGTRDFFRLRIGVGHPGHRDKVTGYLLGRASREIIDGAQQSIEQAMGILEFLVTGKIDMAAHRLHTDS